MRGLVLKTVGLVGPVSEALSPLAAQIRVAFVYGSVAKGTAGASSDVDLMIISEDLSYAEVYAALAKAEQILARPLNPTIVSLAEWRQGRENRNHLVERVSSEPKLFAVGTEDDLA